MNLCFANVVIASWNLEYSARHVYGAAIGGWPANQSLTPAFWHRVTEAFVSNDLLFQQFVSFMTRGFNVSSCTDRCKTDKICGLRALRAENGCVSFTTQPAQSVIGVFIFVLLARSSSWIPFP